MTDETKKDVTEEKAAEDEAVAEEEAAAVEEESAAEAPDSEDAVATEDEEESEDEDEDEGESEDEDEDEDEDESESEDEDESESESEDEDESEDDHHGGGHDGHDHDGHDHHDDGRVLGVAAFFDHPDHLVYAASCARDASFEVYDAFSPFPIHGMDDAMGLGRSWIPWVTFFAGATGFITANAMQFGIMWYDWPMIYGGKPYAAWPSFVPVMFELTVLLAGVTTALVMLYAAGCFRKPFIIDREITNDRFVLWISSADERFERDEVVEFMKELNPMEIRTVRKEGES